MYVNIKKFNEDDSYVYYEFWTDIPNGTYLSRSGNIRYKLDTVYGYCQFNKKTEEFKLDEKKTHSYFLQKNNYEVKKVFFKLLYYKIHNLPFPDKIFIAIG